MKIHIALYTEQNEQLPASLVSAQGKSHEEQQNAIGYDELFALLQHHGFAVLVSDKVASHTVPADHQQ